METLKRKQRSSLEVLARRKRWMLRTSGSLLSEKRRRNGWLCMVLSSLPSKAANTLLQRPKRKIFDQLDEVTDDDFVMFLLKQEKCIAKNKFFY